MNIEILFLNIHYLILDVNTSFESDCEYRINDDNDTDHEQDSLGLQLQVNTFPIDWEVPAIARTDNMLALPFLYASNICYVFKGWMVQNPGLT